jgi:hypothetical protein
MKQKSSVSIELASIPDRNISWFITCYRTTSRELRQSVRARMSKTTMPERCGAGSSSEGVMCERLRRMSGRKADGVQQPGAITPGDHVPGSKILHR